MAKSIIKVIGYETRYSQDNYYLTVVVKNNIITNLYCYNGEIVGDSLRPQQKRILEALKPQERKILDAQVWQVTNTLSGLTTPDNVKNSYDIIEMLYYNNLVSVTPFTPFTRKHLYCTIYSKNINDNIEVDIYHQPLKGGYYAYWIVDDNHGSFKIISRVPLSKYHFKEWVLNDYKPEWKQGLATADLKILDF